MFSSRAQTVVDLLVAPGQAALGLVERRSRLDHLEREAGVFVALLHAGQRREIGDALAGSKIIEGQPADGAGDAALLRQLPDAIGCWIDIFSQPEH